MFFHLSIDLLFCYFIFYILFIAVYSKIFNIRKRINENVFTFLAAPYIKVCSPKDPNINQCITNSIDQLRSKLATGIPELHIPKIEPLLLNNIQLIRGPRNAKFEFVISNLQVGDHQLTLIINILHYVAYVDYDIK